MSHLLHAFCGSFAFAASQVFCTDGEYVEDESDMNVSFDVKEYQQVQPFEELVCNSESSIDGASEESGGAPPAASRRFVRGPVGDSSECNGCEVSAPVRNS